MSVPRNVSRWPRLPWLSAAAVVVCFFFTPRQSSAQAGIAHTAQETPKRFRTCAKCHNSIVSTYSQTAMAQASGPAIDGLITGEMEQRRAGVIYRVYEWMERRGSASQAGEILRCEVNASCATTSAQASVGAPIFFLLTVSGSSLR